MRRCRAARSATSTSRASDARRASTAAFHSPWRRCRSDRRWSGFGIAGAQAAGAPQRLHGAGPVLERLVAGRQVQPRLGRARIVRRHGEELHQPVRRRFGIAVLAGAACQLKKGLAVFRLDLQESP